MKKSKLNIKSELESCLIQPFTVDIPNPPPLLAFDNVPIFTRGNISTISGAPKSGKTMILSYLTAICMQANPSNAYFKTDCKFPGILYFDTEQSIYHSKKCIERICKIAEIRQQQTNFKAFALRNKSVSKRLELIKAGIESYPDTSLVIIDGIADLVESYNDEHEASKIVNILMAKSLEQNCHICTVIHITKSSKDAKGHLGSFLNQKSENVFLVEKSENKLSLRTKVSRDICLPELKFSINQDGIPNLLGHTSHPP
ncbi:AAA family ATPase [Altibacter sp. HG106]|uniref:AAA family ATPase n=1 Tax=Altibacter sp. HG106 TaxID=3023937 RepID=UPI00235000BA|nr:AAA family ATPase [Altibacter sp. HG106]MDC7995507.1 AAA family ATPase [Altibacter sp. HG106]